MGSTPAGDAYCSNAFCGFPQQTCKLEDSPNILPFVRLCLLSSWCLNMFKINAWDDSPYGMNEWFEMYEHFDF